MWLFWYFFVILLKKYFKFYIFILCEHDAERAQQAHRAAPLFCRTLPPGMVDGILPFQDDLGNGDEGVSLLQQVLNNTW